MTTVNWIISSQFSEIKQLILKSYLDSVFAFGFAFTLVLCFSPCQLNAQTAIEQDTVVDYNQLPRTAMFMKQSVQVNQNFQDFFNGHNPKVATWLGFVPGLGQVYNKKFWKLPIVYAGFAVTGYFGISNRNEYREFADAYTCKINEDPDDPTTTCEDPLAQKYTASALKSNRDYYRRNMELSFVIMGIWYILQILDATVDAHLYNWEVDENLSVRVQPVFSPQFITKHQNKAVPPFQAGVNGISVSFNF